MVDTAPVVASKARTFGRLNVAVEPWFCAVVNVPPAMIVLPTFVIALTMPSVMFGVAVEGTAETRFGCARPVSTADAGRPFESVSAVASAQPRAAARRTRRVVCAAMWSPRKDV